ncbi:MAG: 30S ribosomal protein S3, partial [Nanoarchaeota archaeon]
SRMKKEYHIIEYLRTNLKGVGLSHSNVQRTPLGEKIIIYASRPGLVIGGGGSNIKKLTEDLKKEFNLENPQIEISEIENENLVAAAVAEKIAISLEKYGTMRFKGIGHRVMSDVLTAGALGIEIVVSGKIPSARARVWRFYQGYIKKCGDAAVSIVDVAYSVANLKSGIVGIQVRIMPPGIRLPDDIRFRPDPATVEEVPAEEAKKVETEIKTKVEEPAEKPKPAEKKTEKAAKPKKAKPAEKQEEKK